MSTPANESEHGVTTNTLTEKKINNEFDPENPSKKIEKRKVVKNILPGHEHDEMSGTLQKRRGGFGRHMPNAWQSRYFTLRDGVMYYYEDSGSDARPRGKIDLKTEGCDFMHGLIFEGAPTPYTMQIIPRGWDEKWKLCATTKEEMELWVAAIMRHITDETKRKAAPINLKDYDSDGEVDDGEAEEDDDPHLKYRGVPFNELTLTPVTPSTPQSDSANPIPQESSPIRPSFPLQDSTPTSSIFVSPNVPPNPPSPAIGEKEKPSGNKPKRKLKLQTDASTESDEMEFISTLVIVNLCIIFSYTSPSTLLSVVYLVIINIIVARTLQLRSLRLSQLHHAMTTTHAVAIKTLEESHRHALQALKSSLSSTLALSSVAKVEDTVDTQVVDVEEVHSTEGPPPPGTTMSQVIGGVPPDVPTHTWNLCDHSTFNVRVGPDYNKYKRKGPSGKPLYEAYAVDTFCAKNRIDHVAQFIKLENTERINTNNEFVPPLLMVQIQLPSDSPPLFGTIEDGPGWAIVMYFRITQDTCDQLKDLSTASPAVKLFAQYCKYAEKDPAWRGRFKVINFCSNLEEMGVPNVIMSYNAKPVLIRRTGSVFRGTGSSKYLEIDIHVHKFANLAKKSIHALSSRCGLMYMQIGFVIEGKTDEELPETLFACVGVNRPEEDKAEFLLAPEDD